MRMPHQGHVTLAADSRLRASTWKLRMAPNSTLWLSVRPSPIPEELPVRVWDSSNPVSKIVVSFWNPDGELPLGRFLGIEHVRRLKREDTALRSYVTSQHPTRPLRQGNRTTNFNTL